MGQDLVLIEQQLGSAAARIDALVADLESASERRELLLDGIGGSARTRELHDAVVAFDATWRVRRDGLRESLTSLADALRQIDRGFDDADRSLVRSVSAPPSPRGSARQVV